MSRWTRAVIAAACCDCGGNHVSAVRHASSAAVALPARSAASASAASCRSRSPWIKGATGRTTEERRRDRRRALRTRVGERARSRRRRRPIAGRLASNGPLMSKLRACSLSTPRTIRKRGSSSPRMFEKPPRNGAARTMPPKTRNPRAKSPAVICRPRRSRDRAGRDVPQSRSAVVAAPPSRRGAVRVSPSTSPSTRRAHSCRQSKDR